MDGSMESTTAIRAEGTKEVSPVLSRQEWRELEKDDGKKKSGMGYWRFTSSASIFGEKV